MKIDVSKILIIGGICSGKTTLARKLSKELKAKNYELDNIFYKRRDVHEREKPKLRNQKVKSILKKKKWIIEGFYFLPWTHSIYRQADMVIILNVKTSISKNRLIRRFIKRKLSFSNDNTNKKFKTMTKLIKYIDEYPKKYFLQQKETAEAFNKNVLILKDNKDVKQFLGGLK